MLRIQSFPSPEKIKQLPTSTLFYTIHNQADGELCCELFCTNIFKLCLKSRSAITNEHSGSFGTMECVDNTFGVMTSRATIQSSLLNRHDL